jgi:hypothetical protein
MKNAGTPTMNAPGNAGRECNTASSWFAIAHYI